MKYLHHNRYDRMRRGRHYSENSDMEQPEFEDRRIPMIGRRQPDEPVPMPGDRYYGPISMVPMGMGPMPVRQNMMNVPMTMPMYETGPNMMGGPNMNGMNGPMYQGMPFYNSDLNRYGQY
ncbi:hypothetical protein MHBO_000597 [Bonamia ostreae]|uniref:Uncharacterized protein n=1 Tax=Bonamia ostreae TaxID=126728 RepID=A0ABV2AG58_9EUKA